MSYEQTESDHLIQPKDRVRIDGGDTSIGTWVAISSVTEVRAGGRR